MIVGGRQQSDAVVQTILWCVGAPSSPTPRIAVVAEGLWELHCLRWELDFRLSNRLRHAFRHVQAGGKRMYERHRTFMSKLILPRHLAFSPRLACPVAIRLHIHDGWHFHARIALDLFDGGPKSTSASKFLVFCDAAPRGTGADLSSSS
jgi:hypothetical protein